MTDPESPDGVADSAVDEADLRLFDDEDVEARTEVDGAAPMGPEMTDEEVAAIQADRGATGSTDRDAEVN